MPEAHEPVVVVGIDGSESSKQALRWAVRQAELTGAELVAVTAWHLPEMYAYVSRDYDVDAANLLDGVLKEVLDPPPDVPVTRRVMEGRAASVLIDASQDADLLVLGTRGHGGFEGMLLGSVTQHCVHHAACPVVVVPQTQEMTRRRKR
ncbi:universal stress protein [Nocardioides pakistanensis]